jgi:septal ring factor EnvC (AmiA/AmiB activator)
MSDYELGQHSAQIAALTERVRGAEDILDRMDKKLDKVILSIAETAAEQRGQRRVIAFVATAAGGVGSLLITMLVKLVGGE